MKADLQKKVFDFLKKYGVDNTYRDYVDIVKDPGLSDSMYYNYRRRFRGLPMSYEKARGKHSDGEKKEYTRKPKTNIYMPVFMFDSASIPPEAKRILENFVEALNTSKRTKMEVVEYSNPQKIEVREIQ